MGIMMEFYQAVNNRRTVRSLKEEPIASDVLERIIGAGMRAPTHDHRRMWEFVVLREREEKENALQFVKAFAGIQGENGMIADSATPQEKMYAYAMPRQYTMLAQSGCVVLPFFRAGANLFHASSVSSLNSFASVWCCIENIFLAATAEGLACSMRIPVGEEGMKVAEVAGAPRGYMLPCYIGIGYPEDGGTELEQIERDVKDVLHFGKW